MWEQEGVRYTLINDTWLAMCKYGYLPGYLNDIDIAIFVPKHIQVKKLLERSILPQHNLSVRQFN